MPRRHGTHAKAAPEAAATPEEPPDEPAEAFPRYVESGTPLPDFVAHCIKFICYLILLGVQNFTVHRDVWPAKTIVVVSGQRVLLPSSPIELTPSLGAHRSATR